MAGYLKSTRTDKMNRRVHAGLAAMDHRDSFHVYDGDGNYHGDFPTLGMARGCVSFDGLAQFQIIRGDWELVAEGAA